MKYLSKRASKVSHKKPLTPEQLEEAKSWLCEISPEELWEEIEKAPEIVIRQNIERLYGGGLRSFLEMWELSEQSAKDNQFVKTCGCGKSYTQEQWDKLPYKGLIDIRSHLPEDEKDWPGALLALRDCPCKSTLALPVSPKEAEHLKKTYGK